MAKLLATDLDGTLFYPKQRHSCISKKNVAFLRKWIDSGNKLVLVTSRSLHFVKRLEKEIDRPFDVLACTSSQIVMNGKLIRDEKLNNAELQEVLKRIDRKYKPLAYLMTCKNYSCIIKNNRGFGKIIINLYKLWWFLQRKYREPYVTSNKIFYRELQEGDIYKIIIFFGLKRNQSKVSKELNKTLHSDFPGFEFSWINVVNEITPKKCSKGDGLEIYCKHLNINPKDVYVVGDSGNDISMFKKFNENSYCMKHAFHHVKKYASHIVKSVDKLDNILEENKNYESN